MSSTPLDDKVKLLTEARLLFKPVKIAPNVYAGLSSSHGWKSLALEFAKGMPGFCRVIGEKNGLVWQVGNKIKGYIIPPGLLPDLWQAQGIVSAFDPNAVNCFSMGSLARKAIEFIGPAKQWGNDKQVEELLEGIHYGYMECNPGRYALAHKFDVSGYYYNIAKRMPHFKPVLSGGRILWPFLPADERARHVDIMQAVADCKPLRNSIAGALAGSRKWGKIYTAREQGSIVKGIAPFDGPRRTAGLLIVRTAWEITRLEVDNPDTVYSRTDSIITTGNRNKAWERYGFTVKHEGSGLADIIGLGSWRVGDKQSRPYGEYLENLLIPKEQRWEGQGEIPEPITRLPKPERSFLDWL